MHIGTAIYLIYTSRKFELLDKLGKSMLETAISPHDIQNLSQQLKVLANPKRLQIMNHLMEGVQCNCELGESLDLPLNLISHHMGILRKAGLVNIERDAVDGRWVYFSINEPVLLALNEVFEQFFDIERIRPRRPNCGPQTTISPISNVTVVNSNP
jgi:ArsR family transcriptional regulator